MATNEPREVLAPRNASRDLTAVPRTEGALATVGRVTSGMLGIGLATVSGLGIIGIIVDSAKEHLAPSIIGGIFAAASGVAGLVIARWAFRSRRPSQPRPVQAARAESPALASAIRQRMLAVASHYGGRLTAAELAASLGIEESPAARVLETAAETGDARMLFSPEGIAVYEFPGLVAHKAEAKEPWDL
jgi:hypothetical protein